MSGQQVAQQDLQYNPARCDVDGVKRLSKLQTTFDLLAHSWFTEADTLINDFQHARVHLRNEDQLRQIQIIVLTAGRPKLYVNSNILFHSTTYTYSDKWNSPG